MTSSSSATLTPVEYLQRAERAAAAEGSHPVRAVEQVAVVGAGTMGGGIAMSFANAGFAVTLLEADAQALARGQARIKANYMVSVGKGKLSLDEATRRWSRITGATQFSAVATADLVVEAVFEDMAVKQAVFAELDQWCRPDAILSSNTSRLDINRLAQTVRQPERVVGLHFFSPAHVMRLVEVVRGQLSAPDVLETAMAISRRLGKTPVMVGVCDGFVGNRMLSHYLREVGFLLEEGASPAAVDAAMQDFGMAMGPLTVSDMAGLDIPWAARKRHAADRHPALRYSHLADRLCELGRFGVKTGAGYYRYEANQREPIPDPLVEALIVDCANRAGIQRGPVSAALIVERTIYALINEAARLIEDGMVERASDVDVVYVRGYGFPAALGGPVFHADSLGLDRVCQRILEFRERHGILWEPAPLLLQLAASGSRLSDIYNPRFSEAARPTSLA